MITFIAVCLLVLFVGGTFIIWFISQVIGYFIIKWFYKNVLGKPIEEKKDYRGNETYTLFNKERSCITGHIVRRCFLPSGDWVLRDCQTGDTLYNYTQEQRMSNQEQRMREQEQNMREQEQSMREQEQRMREEEQRMREQNKLIQEAKDLGWGCYYSVNEGRRPDKTYPYARIEFSTGKEIWTFAGYDGAVYLLFKRYVYTDADKDSDWIEISLKEYLSLTPRALCTGSQAREIIYPLINDEVIIDEGNEPAEGKYKVDYDKEIRFYRQQLISGIRSGLLSIEPESIYKRIDHINNALQKEFQDCKELYGNEIISKLLKDDVIKEKDKNGQILYELNVEEPLKHMKRIKKKMIKQGRIASSL